MTRKPLTSDETMLFAIVTVLILSVVSALVGKAVHGRDIVVRRPAIADQIAAELVSHGLPTWSPAHLLTSRGDER